MKKFYTSTYMEENGVSTNKEMVITKNNDILAINRFCGEDGETAYHVAIRISSSIYGARISREGYHYLFTYQEYDDFDGSEANFNALKKLIEPFIIEQGTPTGMFDYKASVKEE